MGSGSSSSNSVQHLSPLVQIGVTGVPKRIPLGRALLYKTSEACLPNGTCEKARALLTGSSDVRNIAVNDGLIIRRKQRKMGSPAIPSHHTCWTQIKEENRSNCPSGTPRPSEKTYGTRKKSRDCYRSDINLNDSGYGSTYDINIDGSRDACELTPVESTV